MDGSTPSYPSTMSSYKLNHILRPGTLEAISPALLLSFLSRYHDSLEIAGIHLPPEATEAAIPYNELQAFFSTLEPDAHEQLAEALFYVNETTGNEDCDKLIDACEALSVPTAANDTAADLAIRLWMHSPSSLERLHAQANVHKCQRFDFHRPQALSDAAFTMPSDIVLQQIASDMDEWFDRKRKGRGCRVFCYQHSQVYRFLVRRGDLYVRMQIHGTEDGVIHYRPAKHDVLMYNAANGELGINTPSKGLRQEYLNAFGHRLFGSAEHFQPFLKYTLEPIATRGKEALTVGNFCEHIDWIHLVELHVHNGGPFNSSEILRADDVLAELESRDRAIPAGSLLRAKFSVKFVGQKRPRQFTLLPPTTSRMTREADAEVLEAWLQQQGFIETHPVTSDIFEHGHTVDVA